jgi:hypothetical protein
MKGWIYTAAVYVWGRWRTTDSCADVEQIIECAMLGVISPPVSFMRLFISVITVQCPTCPFLGLCVLSIP